jgi:hypothetical protein
LWDVLLNKPRPNHAELLEVVSHDCMDPNLNIGSMYNKVVSILSAQANKITTEVPEEKLMLVRETIEQKFSALKT